MVCGHCSVTQLCPTLCDPLDCSMPGLPVHNQEFIQTPGVCSNSRPLSQWCHPTISSSVAPSSPAANLFQHQGLFQWVGSLHQVAKVLCGQGVNKLPEALWEHSGLLSGKSWCLTGQQISWQPLERINLGSRGSGDATLPSTSLPKPEAHEDSAWSGDLHFKKEEKRGASRAMTARDSSPGQTLGGRASGLGWITKPAGWGPGSCGSPRSSCRNSSWSLHLADGQKQFLHAGKTVLGRTRFLALWEAVLGLKTSWRQPCKEACSAVPWQMAGWVKDLSPIPGHPSQGAAQQGDRTS